VANGLDDGTFFHVGSKSAVWQLPHLQHHFFFLPSFFFLRGKRGQSILSSMLFTDRSKHYLLSIRLAGLAHIPPYFYLSICLSETQPSDEQAPELKIPGH
jgi:hypothetical protein